MSERSLYVRTNVKIRQIETVTNAIIEIDIDPPFEQYSRKIPFPLPNPSILRCSVYAVYSALELMTTHAELVDTWDTLVVTTPCVFLEEIIGTDLDSLEKENKRRLYDKWASTNKWPQSMKSLRTLFARIQSNIDHIDKTMQRRVHIFAIGKKVNKDDPTDMNRTYRAVNRKMFDKTSIGTNPEELQEKLTAMTLANVDMEQCKHMRSKQGHRKVKPTKTLHKQKQKPKPKQESKQDSNSDNSNNSDNSKTPDVTEIGKMIQEMKKSPERFHELMHKLDLTEMPPEAIQQQAKEIMGKMKHIIDNK